MTQPEVRRFAGRRALVTGAGSGVGRSVALALAAEGAAVALVGRGFEPLEAVAAEIEAAGGTAAPQSADVASADQVSGAVDAAAAALGGLDLLVNAAGALRYGTILTISEEDWDATFDTNVKGCFLTCRAALPHLRDGGGAVVNVASVVGLASSPNMAAYASSKAAVISLTKSMALDHIGAGVRINAVAPGSIDTPMLRGAIEGLVPGSPDWVIEAAGKLHPNGRLVGTDEVTELILFLLSDAAQAVVGAVIPIDGGRSAKLGQGG